LCTKYIYFRKKTHIKKYKPCKTGTCDVGTFSAGFGLDLGGSDGDQDGGGVDGSQKDRGPIYAGSCITTEMKWSNKPAGLSLRDPKISIFD